MAKEPKEAAAGKQADDKKDATADKGADKAEAKADTKEPKKSQNGKVASHACLLEIVKPVGVGGSTYYPIILTEFGAKKVGPGTQLLVDSDIAQRVVEQYAPHLKMLEQHKAVKGLKEGHYEYVKVVDPAKGPQVAGDKGPTTATNKSLDGKTETK